MGNGPQPAAPLLVAGRPILVALAPNCLFRWDMSLEKVRGEGGPGADRKNPRFWLKPELCCAEGPLGWGSSSVVGPSSVGGKRDE